MQVCSGSQSKTKQGIQWIGFGVYFELYKIIVIVVLVKSED
jgi:hypothetical protein